MTEQIAKIPPIDPAHAAVVERYGGKMTALEPIGLQVSGMDLTACSALPTEVLVVLEQEMAKRGFLVFKNETQVSPDDFLRASCWWGVRELHSTHGVHP